MTPIARLIYAGVLIYRYARAGWPSPCRFIPSCSSYALDALERHGALSGGWLIARRLFRCHPWGGSGVDPVPCAVRYRSVVCIGRSLYRCRYSARYMAVMRVLRDRMRVLRDRMRVLRDRMRVRVSVLDPAAEHWRS